MMKNLKLKNYTIYAVLVCCTILFTVLASMKQLSFSTLLQLESATIAMILAASLCLVVGFLGELSLGHAGFMCVGAFLGAKTAVALTASMGPGNELVILLLTGLLVSRYIGQQQERIAKTLEDRAWMALSDQWSDARQAAAEARQQWEESWSLRAAFGDHTPMEEIDELFAQLNISASAGERTGFAQDCVVLASWIRAVGNAHRLSWQNVL